MSHGGSGDNGTLGCACRSRTRRLLIGNWRPIRSAACGAHAPAQLTTMSVRIVPLVVRTAPIRSASRSNPTPSTPHSTGSANPHCRARLRQVVTRHSRTRPHTARSSISRVAVGHSRGGLRHARPSSRIRAVMSFFTRGLGAVCRPRIGAPPFYVSVHGYVADERREHGAAVRQVAQMVLESSEAGHRLTRDPEGGHAVRNALLRVWQHLQDRHPQHLQSAPLRLVQRRQVPVHLRCRHDSQSRT